jgi:hypothetical protein
MHIGLPCLSDNVIQLGNCWMNFDEIWYGYYATEGYPKLVQMFELVTWEQNCHHLVLKSCMLTDLSKICNICLLYFL